MVGEHTEIVVEPLGRAAARSPPRRGGASRARRVALNESWSASRVERVHERVPALRCWSPRRHAPPRPRRAESSRSSSSSPVISMRRSRSNSRPMTAAALSARAGGFGKVLDPPPDHLLHAVGHAERLEREAAARVRGTDLVHVAADLTDEERVALRLAAACSRTNSASGAKAQATRHSRPTSPSSRPDSSSSSTGVVAAQLGDRAPERMVVGHLVGCGTCRGQQPRRIPVAREMRQQRERRPVGPVQVFEHEQHRRRGTRACRAGRSPPRT